MKDLVSPKQVARAIGVSESSLKRWCDQGLLPTVRTAGGHRRLPISGVLAYLRSTQRGLIAPELLGLPATSGRSDRVIERGHERMRDALLEGDETRARQIALDLWLSGQTLACLFDQVIAAAFRDIGAKWACQEADVFQERRACEITLRVLHELRMGLPPVDPGWIAIGGTIEGDQYLLPTTMAEIVLREQGWDARSIGASLPFTSLAEAVRVMSPRLVWISVSYIPDRLRFVEGFSTLNDAADEIGAALAVGGFALESGVRHDIRYSAYCDSMVNLADFAKTLRRSISRPAGAAGGAVSP